LSIDSQVKTLRHGKVKRGRLRKKERKKERKKMSVERDQWYRIILLAFSSVFIK
jgi:hypothetical protein